MVQSFTPVLPVGSEPPRDWWRRVSTAVNSLKNTMAGLYRRETTPVTTAGPYEVKDTDYFLALDSSAGAITATLPSPSAGRELVAKRMNGGSNAITLNGAVDNLPSITLAGQWSSLSLIGNGDRWLIVSKYVP